MRRSFAATLCVAITVLFTCWSAQAQNTTALVVATCGTLSTPLVVGSARPITIDTTGKICDSGGGGGGAATIADGADATQGAIADAPATAGGTGTESAKLRLMTSQLNTIATNTGSPATFSSQYPDGAIPITASATGTTAATAATLAAHATRTTYICGFSIRANATAAATANSTVAGTITGTLNYTQWTAPLASGIGITEQIFTPCVPGSATNTAIVATSAAPGSGGVVSVSAWGYQL